LEGAAPTLEQRMFFFCWRLLRYVPADRPSVSWIRDAVAIITNEVVHKQKDKKHAIQAKKLSQKGPTTVEKQERGESNVRNEESV